MSPDRFPSLAGIIGFLAFGTVVFYPFEEARLRFGGLEFPFATILIAALLIICTGRIVFGRVRLEVSSRLVASTWLLLVGIALSTLVATFSNRGTEFATVAEATIFVVIPCLFAITMTRSTDAMLCSSAFFAGVVYLTGYGLYRYATEGHGWVEFHYQEATRNGDALYLVAAFCMSFAFLVHGVRRSWPMVNIAPLTGLVAVAGIAVALSFARGAWIGAAVGAVFILRIYRKSSPEQNQKTISPKLVFSLLFLIVAAAFMVPRLVGPTGSEALGERFRSITDSSVEGASNRERTKLVHATVAAIPRWGWTGTGIDNFAFAIEPHRLRLEHGHNVFSTIWIELGIVAFIGLILLMRELAPTFAADDGSNVWRTAVSAVVLAWLVNGLFETPSESVFFWSLLGLVLAMSINKRSQHNGGD